MAANGHLKFHGKKMSEAIDNMDAYIQLTDEVFQQILRSTETHENMEEVFNFMVPISLQMDMHIKFLS